MTVSFDITNDPTAIRATFGAYRGFLATFVAYAISKQTVLVEFGRPALDHHSEAVALPPSRYILFYGCSHISLPARWLWTRPLLSTVDAEEPALLQATFQELDGCSVFLQFEDIQPLDRRPDLFGGATPTQQPYLSVSTSKPTRAAQQDDED